MIVRRFQTDKNTLFGIVAVLLWSTTIALVRSLAEEVGPLTAGASVHLIGGAVCVAQFLWVPNSADQTRRLPRLYLLGCGALFVIYIITIYLAVGLATDRNQTLEIGLLNYLWPVLTILFSLFLLNKKANVLLAPGILLGLTGLFVVFQQGSSISWTSLSNPLRGNPLAYFLALVAAVSWALYSNLTRRWAGLRPHGAVSFFLLATGLVLLCLRFFWQERSSWDLSVAAEICFLGLSTALAYVAWDIAMRKGDVVFVAAFSYFAPFFSTLMSCLYLKIWAGWHLWSGCCLIVAGSLLSWISVSNQTKVEGPLNARFSSRRSVS